MKTYDEAMEVVKKSAEEMNWLIRENAVANGAFALVGHVISEIYGVDDEKIIQDLQIEHNGIIYKLIEVK